jgi:serine protease Do
MQRVSSGLNLRRAQRLGLAISFAVALLACASLPPASLLLDPASAAENDAGHASGPIGFANIVADVKPAVIAVTVRLEDTVEPETSDQQKSPQSPLYRHFFGNPDETNNPPVRRFATALGSGFFISADGYAVTNYHVVEHGKSFKIATQDGKSYTA